MELMAGYKQTELGSIPSDWEMCTFGEVITGFSSGATPYRGIIEYYKGNIRWITSGELNYNTITDTIEKITDEAVKRTNLKLHPSGTFLIAITGLEAEGTRGSCAFVGAPSTTNQSCMALYPIKSKLDTKFLYHYYCWQGNNLALKYCQGTKQQSYTAGIAKKLPIILPPLSEQQAISEVLSDTDNLIQALEKLIAKKRLVKQGAMQDLLISKEGWEEKTIKEVTNKFIDYRGVTPKKLGMEWGDGEILALSANNVVMGFIDKSKECYYGSETLYKKWMRNGDCSKGDILITMEAPLGNIAFIPDDNKYILSQRTVLIKPNDQIIKEYFRYYLMSQIFQTKLKENATGSTAQGIQRKKLEQITVCFPKSLDMQKSISKTLLDIDSEIELLVTKLSKYKQLKQGLMQNLLTGKMRLTQ